MIPKGTIFKTLHYLDGNTVYFKLVRDHYSTSFAHQYYGEVIYNTMNEKLLQFVLFEQDFSQQLTEEEIKQLNKLIIFSS